MVERYSRKEKADEERDLAALHALPRGPALCISFLLSVPLLSLFWPAGRAKIGLGFRFPPVASDPKADHGSIACRYRLIARRLPTELALHLRWNAIDQ